MKILVAVKRVIDPYVKIRVRADGSGVETDNVKMAMNPFDEIALEEAIRLKESGVASEVIALSIGDASAQETLRTALAIGADRAILINHDQPLESLLVAKLLQAVVAQEQPDLVLLGKQAIDDDSNQVGQQLAALLNWPQASFVSKINIEGQTLKAVCEVDAGLLSKSMTLPVVVTADLRLNEPRYATLPNIMKARQKPLAELSINEFGIDLTPRSVVQSVISPPKRAAGCRVENVQELLEKLQHEAKVLQ